MSLKKQAISGAKWSFIEQFSVQIINFGVQIILARLLMPEMFGLIAMIVIFISIGQTLMDGGMTSSLIRTKNPNQLDYSTVFVTNIIVSFIIYGVVYFLAPFIAEFYNQDILTDIVRLLALTFVIRALVAVHVAKLTKEMNFKLQMKLQIPATIISGVVGVTMAYKGYGVWSLVWLNIVQAIVFTLQFWFLVKWRPSFIFNKERFKYHFKFGYKLTLSGLLDSIYRDLYRIVIGKMFSPAQVGFFNQAETMRNFPVDQVSSVMSKVTYPLFASLKNDKTLKSAYKKTMKLVFFVVAPIMMGLAVGGKEIFLIVLGEKWLPAVPFFQILAIASIVKPLSSYNLNILKVKGRSDIYLKLEIIKKTIAILVVFIAAPFGIMALVISYAISTYLNTVINMVVSGRLIKYSFYEQTKDCSSIFINGLVAMILTYLMRLYLVSVIDSELVILVLLVSFYSTIYIVMSLLFERSTIIFLKDIIVNLNEK